MARRVIQLDIAIYKFTRKNENTHTHTPAQAHMRNESENSRE